MLLKRLIIVVMLTVFVAYATGRLFDHLYKKRWATLFFEKTDALIKDTTNYDIIFLGNSRVHFGINPFYIDSVTALNSYNFGIGGADATDIMLTAGIYLQQHPAPKLVVISVDGGAITKNTILQSRFHYLYYLENDTISKYMKQAGFLTGLIKALPFTKYSFFDEYNRTSLFVKGNQYPQFNHNMYKGFLNVDQQINGKAAARYNNEKESYYLWDTAVTYLSRTISVLQKKGCEVVLVSPPLRSAAGSRGTAFKKTADSVFTKMAADNHLRYLHFENDPLYTDDYFVDDIHLNEPGTQVYSMQLADTINHLYPYLKQPALQFK